MLSGMAQLLVFVVSVLLLAAGCGGARSSDAEFETLANGYLEGFLELSPEWATQLGDHSYDHLLSDYTLNGVDEGLRFERGFQRRLAAIDPAGLNETNAVDYEILRNRIDSSIFAAEELREHEWNPLVYNPGGSIYALVARDFAPAAERLRNAKARLEAVPGVLAAARANLNNPPLVHTETAILQNGGVIGLVRDDLEELVKQAPEIREELAPAREAAVAALEEYGKWLKEDLLPRSNGNFRIGEQRFRRKLAYRLHSDLSMEQILARAEEALAETHAAMYETALPLHERFFPDVSDADRSDEKKIVREVLDKLAETRPTSETIVDDARRDLEEVTAFTREKRLISLPEEPLEIIVMPEFQRGVSVAYCDSPGPLEKNAKTFYAIAPTHENWSEERSESLYREYNSYMLKDLTIHEATPGHYLQLAHSNRFQAPTMIRGVFYSGPFVEGWAVYAEQVMAEHGYGGPEVRMQQLKMLVRAILNAILDQKIHAGSMTEQEAMDLMINEGFQEDGEAAGKWRRACLTSAQLSTYFVGNAEVRDIREAWEEQHGPINDFQAFHDKVLSFGSPPAKFVRRLMGL